MCWKNKSGPQRRHVAAASVGVRYYGAPLEVCGVLRGSEVFQQHDGDAHKALIPVVLIHTEKNREDRRV